MNHTILGSNVLMRSITFEERIDESVLGENRVKNNSLSRFFFFFAHKHTFASCLGKIFHINLNLCMRMPFN